MLLACAAAVTVAAAAAFVVARLNRPPKLLQTVAEIRQLSPAECRRGLPARLRGVVLYINVDNPDGFFLQDSTAAVRVDLPQADRTLGRDQVVEVEGITAYADGAPVIRASSTHPYGMGRVPLPKPVTAHDIVSGRWQHQYVEFPVTVRAFTVDSDLETALDLESGGVRVLAIPAALIDPELLLLVNQSGRVGGIVENRYSLTGALIQARIQMTRSSDLIGSLGVPVSHEPPAGLPTLTRVEQIDALLPGPIPAYRVHLRGVVTFVDPASWFLFVQDETAGVYVMVLPDLPPNLTAGMEVEVRGRASIGRFAPIIADPKVIILGPGQFPIPKRLPEDEIIAGRFDSEWVEVEGIVRRVEGPQYGRADLVLATGSERLSVRLPWPHTRALPLDLVDARVRVHGVYGVLSNQLRQLTGIQILVPGWEHVSVIERAPHGPAGLRPQPIHGLLQYSATASLRHRFKISGAVTYASADTVFIQDATGGLMVRTAGGPRVRVGDRVEALGFISAPTLSPVLEDAVLRVTGREALEPREITAADAAAGLCRDHLVRIESLVLDTAASLSDYTLVLQAEKLVFNALQSGVGGAG
ncbi:MAG: hypothetical protein ABSD27_14585, partial [Bryobacteraceae bacterium]